MENLIFALNAVVPVFLIIVLGWYLKKIGMFNAAFCKAANAYVFTAALPVNLFRSIVGMDFYSDFDPAFCLFCAGASTCMFMGVWATASVILKDRRQIGAFSQAAARSSIATLGLALAMNIYGSTGMVPLMILTSVPLFNIFSVLVLSFSPQTDESGSLIPAGGDRQAVLQACRNVLTNPLIIGVLAGFPFALLQIRIPTMLDSALSSLGATATPVALLVVGASFSGAAAQSSWRGAAGAAFVKLIVLPLVFLPAGILLGFRGTELIAILIMAGSPTTPSSYVMARSMRGDSVLTANAIVLSTAFSAFTITFWLYLLKAFGMV